MNFIFFKSKEPKRMSDVFEFKSEELGELITIKKDSEPGNNQFIAETVFEHVRYISLPTNGKGFEQTEISDFSGLHSMFPPKVVLQGNTIKVSYSVPFLKSYLEFSLLKEEMTPEKEMLVKYKKNTELIGELNNRIRAVENLKPIGTKPGIIEIRYNEKRGLYFTFSNDKLERWFEKVVWDFCNNNDVLYPTYDPSKPSDWRKKYRSATELFRDVKNLYCMLGVNKNYINLLYRLRAIFGSISTEFPYAMFNDYAEKAGYSLSSHPSREFPLSALCNELNVTDFKVAELHVFATPNYKIFKNTEDADYKRSIILKELNIIDWKNYISMFGIYPNGLYNIIKRNLKVWNSKTQSSEGAIVVFDRA